MYSGSEEDWAEANDPTVFGLTVSSTVSGASRKPLPSTQYVPGDKPLVGMVTGFKFPFRSAFTFTVMTGIAPHPLAPDAYS